MTTKEKINAEIYDIVSQNGGEVKCSIGARDVKDEFFYSIGRMFIENETLYAEGNIDEYYYEMREMPAYGHYEMQRVKLTRRYDDCGLIDLNRIPMDELKVFPSILKDYIRLYLYPPNINREVFHILLCFLYDKQYDNYYNYLLSI